MCSGRQSRPHLFHVVRKVCTKSGHVSTIPPVVKNNSHHGISTIKSDYPFFASSARRREDQPHTLPNDKREILISFLVELIQ